MPTTKAKARTKAKTKSTNAKKKKKKKGEAERSGGERDTRSVAKDQRQLVQERKILRSQSRWLQKALFALGKAEDDHTKLAEVRGESHEPMSVTIDVTKHGIDVVTVALRDSVMERLEGLRVSLRKDHDPLR